MSDERYSVTFDFLSKGGTPLVMQSPPLGGAGGAGGPGARGRNSAGAGQSSSVWGPLLLAAVLRGGIAGLGRVKKIPLPKTKTTPPRTDVFTGNKDLMDSIPHRNVTPAQMAKARRAAIRAQMEAAAAKQRNRTLRGENKELTGKNTELSAKLDYEEFDHGLTKDKLLKMESADAMNYINRSLAQRKRQIREKGYVTKDYLPKPELGVLKVTKLEIEKASSSTPTAYVTPAASSAGTASKTFEATVKLLQPSRSSGITDTTKQLIDTSRQNNIVDAGETQ